MKVKQNIPRHVIRWNLRREPSGVEMAFCEIPPGRFLMGSFGEYGWEEPRHEVEISKSFWLAETPVTQDQFVVWTKECGVEH